MNKYAKMPADKLENHLNNFLITHWSVSGVQCFKRNEKSFERSYIFRERDQQSSLASLIGTAYHDTLMQFFVTLRDKKSAMGYDELVAAAHENFLRYGANRYKPSKKKSIEELRLEGLKHINTLIENFCAELPIYLENIQEVVMVEEIMVEFVTLAGVDVPLPLKFVPDLVFIDKDGYLCILDHKSKYSYTNDKDINYNYGDQSIAYSIGTPERIARSEFDWLRKKYPKVKEGVKTFYFYENKYTKNKDGSPQIKLIPVDIAEGRAIYEEVLLEGVRKMIAAVQDPDYIYLMNPNDHFVEGDELLQFWVKTKIGDLESFTELNERQKKILSRKKKSVQAAALANIPKHVVRKLASDKNFLSLNFDNMDELTPAQRIEHRLKTFGYITQVEHVIEGYSCDTYLLAVGAGTQIGQIYKYKLDIANAIGEASVRIPEKLVRHENGSYIAIEVNRRETKPLVIDKFEKGSLEIPLGMDNFGNRISWDLGNPSTPHLLGGGGTGSGKSVAIKTIIKAAKAQLGKSVEITILDPKNEFAGTAGAKVINQIEDMEEFMREQVDAMEEVFARGTEVKVRQLVVIDELNDILSKMASRKTLEKTCGYATAAKNVSLYREKATREEMKGEKGEAQALNAMADDAEASMQELEKRCRTFQENNIILLQKARSAGYHFVEFGQRLTSKALDGNAKANFSSRLCLTMPSAIDSRVILDAEGAESLNGKGDALYTSPNHTDPVRIQCFCT